MPTLIDVPVEVVEKDGASIKARNSTLGDELRNNKDDRLRLILANPKIPNSEAASLEPLVPWGFRKMIGRSANGGGGCRTSFKDGRIQHDSWFYFLRQVVHHDKRNNDLNTQWAAIDVLISWNSKSHVTLVLYLGKVDSTFRKTLEAAVASDRDAWDPYTWHRLIIDWADEAYNSSVWRLLAIVSAVENFRSPEGYDFDLLHDVSRLIIQSNETLEAAVNTMGNILKSHALLDEELQRAFGSKRKDTSAKIPVQPQTSQGSLEDASLLDDNSDRMVFYRTHQDLCQLGNCLRSDLLFSQTIKDRLQNEINLAFNLVAQRDGQLARIDNMTMKTITAVTLAFLPGTFIASLFGMSFFDFSADSDGQTWAVSEKLWLYWAITLPLTLLTLGSWWTWDFGQKQWKFHRHSRRMQRDTTEKPKQEGV